MPPGGRSVAASRTICKYAVVTHAEQADLLGLDLLDAVTNEQLYEFLADERHGRLGQHARLHLLLFGTKSEQIVDFGGNVLLVKARSRRDPRNQILKIVKPDSLLRSTERPRHPHGMEADERAVLVEDDERRALVGGSRRCGRYIVG